VPFLSVSGDGSAVIKIYVQPRASKTRVIGLYDGMLKLGVTSPPVDGKANNEVVKYLAKCLKIPKNNLVLSTGLHSRRKTVTVTSIGENEIRRAFEPFL